MEIDLEEIIAILEMPERSDVTEFQLDRGDLHLSVRRRGAAPASDESGGNTSQATRVAPQAAPSGTVAPPASRSAGAAEDYPGGTARVPQSTDSPPSPSASAALEGEVLVPAPMLGVFYSSPKPGTAPFVQVGDCVDEQTEVGVLEVMKLFNTVRAGTRGLVTRLLVQDGDMVEYGQPLVAIRPTP